MARKGVSKKQVVRNRTHTAGKRGLLDVGEDRKNYERKRNAMRWSNGFLLRVAAKAAAKWKRELAAERI